MTHSFDPDGPEDEVFKGRVLDPEEPDEGDSPAKPRKLPIVSFADVTRGLTMPGEQRNIGVPKSTAEKYLEVEDYYLDERLKELRGVKTVSVIRLNDFEIEWFKERAR